MGERNGGVKGKLSMESANPCTTTIEDSPISWVGASGIRPDFETAVLLRSNALPIIEKAESWSELIFSLAKKNFGLAIQSGRLVLTNHSNGTRICTGRHLGTPLSDLVSRLGKPHVRALPGNGACGEILRETMALRTT